MTTFRDNGFELPIGPPRIDFARNSYAYQYEPEIMPKKNAIDYLIDAFKAPSKPQPKRNPYIFIRRRSSYGGHSGTRHAWHVFCVKCKIPGVKGIVIARESNWATSIQKATRHAHNHHGK